MVPINNFTATFSKLGYIALKTFLDNNNIIYNKYTIIQASDIKSKIKNLKIKNQNMIVSIDIINFCFDKNIINQKNNQLLYNQVLKKINSV